jgi:hypothetical protein
MHSGDPEKVPVSAVLLEPGIAEPLDLGIEQLVQAAIGVQP